MSVRSSDKGAFVLLGAVITVALAMAGCASRGAMSFDVVSVVNRPTAEPMPVVVAQAGHPAAISALDIDPYGTLVVTGAGSELLLWEIATGRVQARLDHLEGAIRSVAFSWSDRFGLGGVEAPSVLFVDDWGLKRWSLDTDVVLPLARGVTRVRTGNAGEIVAAEGRHLLFGLQLWEPWDGLGPQQVRSPPVLRSLLHLAGTIEHIDVTQWYPCRPYRCDTTQQTALSDRNGQIILTNLDQGNSLWFDEANDPCEPGPLRHPPTNLALSRDGARLAAAFPGRVLVWEIENKRRLGRAGWYERVFRSTCLRDTSRRDSTRVDDLVKVAALQFHYDSEGLTLIGEDGSIRTWDLAADRIEIEAAPAPGSAGPGRAALNVTRRWLVFEQAGEVRVRNLSTNSEVARFPVTTRGQKITAVDLSEQRGLAVAREDRVEVWDLERGTLVCLDDMAMRAAWSPDGRHLAGWQRQDPHALTVPRLLVHAVDRANADDRLALEVPEAEYPWPPIAWVDAKHILLSVGKSLVTWDLDTGTRSGELVLSDDNSARAASLAVRSGRVAAIMQGVKGERLVSFELADPRGAASVPLAPTSGSVALSPDGARIGTTHGAHPTTIWDAQKMRPIAVKIASPAKPSVDEFVLFTPDNAVIARRVGGKMRLLMDEGSSSSLNAHPVAADITADGRLVAVAALDGVYLRRVGEWASREGGVHLVGATAGRCDGLVLSDKGWIDARSAETSTLFVRLGSPFAGALVPSSALPEALRREHLLRDFVDGLEIPARTESTNPPELRHVRRYWGWRIVVALSPTKSGAGVLCLTIRPAGGSSPLERCVDAEQWTNTLDIPTIPLESVWVRACDASRNVCGRSIRAYGEHKAIGHFRSHPTDLPPP